MNPADKIHALQAGLDFHPGQRVLDTITGQDGSIIRGRWVGQGKNTRQTYQVKLQDLSVVERYADSLVLY